ncbi:MAG: helix-turn-helix domain-containing protein [Chloroflexi bacterium]|nr:helix-turn-helix domain-containing protein [Chloroflexota bacterium]
MIQVPLFLDGLHKVVTVREIWKSALPPGTELLAGDNGLSREVTWVASLRPRPPAFDALKGGEIALVSLSALKMLDERVDLAELINRLQGMGVVAIAVSSGFPDQPAVDAAEALDVPLFGLPPDTILGEIERQIARLLAERRTDMYARSQELNRQLMEMAIEGKGVAALVRKLSQVSGRVAVLEDDELIPRFCEVPVDFPASAEEVLPLLEADRSSLASRVEELKLSPSDPPTMVFSLPAFGYRRVVAPVATRDRVMAYLSLVAPADEVNELDHLAASRGAAALVVELARERAVLDAEDRMQESFVDALLNGSYTGEEVMLSRAKRLGYDMSGSHAVLVLRLHLTRPQSETASAGDNPINRQRKEIESAVEREMRRRAVEAPMRIKGESVTLLYPVGADIGEQKLRDLGLNVRSSLSDTLGTSISAGIGRLHKGLEGVRAAYREAEQAVILGIRLFGRGSATYFGDLGLYRLLLSIQATQELRTYYLETLGKLLEYDRKNGSELVKTLEAFFASCGSPTDAADRLHLHRNTLLYRLHRIREISGLDLNDPEVRLSLHLALRVGQALSAAKATSGQKS